MSIVNTMVAMGAAESLAGLLVFSLVVLVVCWVPWPLVKQNIKAGEDEEKVDSEPTLKQYIYVAGEICPKCYLAPLQVKPIDPEHDGSATGTPPWQTVSCACGFTIDQQLNIKGAR